MFSPPRAMHTVSLQGKQSAPRFSDQQTQAAANYQRALADYQSNRRMTSKQYQRPGLSSGAGTAYAGMADSAAAYAKGMAGAEAARMEDAYANAGMELGDQARNSQFGSALAGLNEQRVHRQAMDRYQTIGNATDFMGSFMASGPRNRLVNSVLSGLY